jgi:sugar phosphate isomerase/epimerase
MLGAATAAPLVAAPRPAIAFPKEPRKRIAVASYPFRDQHIPLTKFPAMVVERYKLFQIEPLSDHFQSRDAAYLRELRTANEQAGVTVVNIPVSLRGSLYDPDEAKRAAAVQDSKGWVDAAVAIGSPSVRIHLEGVKGVAPDVDRAAASLKLVAAYGAQKNVVINLENDDPKSEEAFFLVKVIDKVASPWLHGLPDFCNSMLIGPDQYNYDAVRAMFQRAYCISHVKDSEVDEGKVYRVDVDRTFAIAKAAGYRGFFSMEWEGQGDPFTGTQKLIDMTLKNLA